MSAVLAVAERDFATAADAEVAAMIGRGVSRLIANPHHARAQLVRHGLDMLPWSAVAARAEALFEQEDRRPHRGAFEFGRMRDLRVLIAYAKHMEIVTCR